MNQRDPKNLPIYKDEEAPKSTPVLDAFLAASEEPATPHLDAVLAKEEDMILLGKLAREEIQSESLPMETVSRLVFLFFGLSEEEKAQFAPDFGPCMGCGEIKPRACMLVRNKEEAGLASLLLALAGGLPPAPTEPIDHESDPSLN